MTDPKRRRIARRLVSAAALLAYGVIVYMVAAAFWSFVG